MKQNRNNNGINGVPAEESVADLEQALTVAGFGWYNVKYCLVQTLFLISAILEIMGYSYILPSAKCDLDMTDAQRGFIASIPYIGIILTSFAWGYVVDTLGRKRAVIYSSLATGGFSITAAFMPDLISFTVFKFLAALCVGCPSATPYTIIGEIVPIKQRDLMLSITNAQQLMGAALVPLLAWGILALDIRVDFGAYYFRSWRLLSITFSCLFIISIILMSFGPESAKYLMSNGKHDEALKVLQEIYAGNTGKSVGDYPIKKIKYFDNDAKKDKVSFLNSLKVQSIPLFKPPYLKWLALEGFLLFGLYAALNGIFMWVPDVLNRVFSGDGNSESSACEIISLGLNNTLEGEEVVCTDNLDRMTFIITASASSACAVIAVGVSSLLKFYGKKAITISIMFLIAAFCFASVIVTQPIVFAILLCGLQLGGICIGPINAFAIESFPTKLRGMGLSLVIMFGRMGSVFGTNITGILLNNSCPTTFYMYGGLLTLCGLLTFLLPNNGVKQHNPKEVNRKSSYTTSNIEGQNRVKNVSRL